MHRVKQKIMGDLERGFVALRRVPNPAGYGGVSLALAAAWGVTFVAGGSATPYPHLFYVPILLAAARAGWIAAGCTSLAAGVLAGPTMPLNVAAGSSQRPADWLARLVMFVLIGQVTAWLGTRSYPSIRSAAELRRGAAEMAAALDRAEFLVHYQPIVELASGRIVGAEALLRWRKPGHGVLPPSSFIERAEASGVIVDIGRWVLNETAKQAAEWQRIIGDREFSVAVNVSAKHLEEGRLVEDVKQALAASGLEPRCLHLELTETALLVDIDVAAAVFTQIRELGVHVTVDDFGVAQSSLSYLQHLPLDAVKVDRAFVSEIGMTKQGGSIAAGIIGLADALGLRTVAEGVEHRHQVAALAAYGCKYAQGYFFDRPMPEDEFATRLHRGNYSVVGAYAGPYPTADRELANDYRSSVSAETTEAAWATSVGVV